MIVIFPKSHGDRIKPVALLSDSSVLFTLSSLLSLEMRLLLKQANKKTGRTGL